MNFQNLKQKRSELEANILKLVQQFEQEAKGEVTALSISRIEVGTFNSPNDSLVTGVAATVIWREGEDEITIK